MLGSGCRFLDTGALLFCKLLAASGLLWAITYGFILKTSTAGQLQLELLFREVVQARDSDLLLIVRASECYIKCTTLDLVFASPGVVVQAIGTAQSSEKAVHDRDEDKDDQCLPHPFW